MAFFFGFGYDKEGYNKKGFNKEGYNRDGYDVTGYNRLGFDAEGYDKYGFDSNGYNRAGFNKSGYNIEGFDSDGYDVNGYDKEGYNARGYDRDGFNKQGYDWTGYNQEGFNRSGYDKNGYNRQGYDKDGYNKEGYNREGYNRQGYDINGYDRDGFNKYGYDKTGFNDIGYDEAGYDRLGYDVSGYDREGFDKNGYSLAGYDKEGFNRSGYDKNGYNRQGYDKDGYNEEGYNREGYNRQGYDINGCDRDGFNKYGYDKTGFNRRGYDKAGFDKKGYDKDGYDKEGFSPLGYDRDGFSRDGYNSSGYNREGYNRQGFDRNGYDKDSYDRTGYNKAGYNRYGFNREGFNRQGYDAHGFNKDGYDKLGYNRDGYNIYGYDRDGYNRQGYDMRGNSKSGCKIEAPLLGNLFKKYNAIIVFDVETTGLDPEKDQIVEISAERITLDNGKINRRSYQSFIRLYDGHKMSNEATRITHITDEVLNNQGHTILYTISEFLDFVEKGAHPRYLFVSHNAAFDMAFLEKALIKVQRQYFWVNVDVIDTLTVFKDRHAYPHKLSDAIVAYNLMGTVKNSHSAYDDVMALTEVFIAMYEEKDDLSQYINLFGYNPKYPPVKKLQKFRYLAQAFNPTKPLYKKIVQERITQTTKQEERPRLLTCPDCKGTVSHRAEACPHCGCPIAYVLEAEQEPKPVKKPYKSERGTDTVSRSEIWEEQKDLNFSRRPKMAYTEYIVRGKDKEENKVQEIEKTKKFDKFLGVAVSYDLLGSGWVSTIDKKQITIHFISDGQERSFSLDDFSKHGRFMMVQDARAFSSEFNNEFRWHGETNRTYMYSEPNGSYTYDAGEEIDERLDDNYYIGDGDDWNEYY